jgi:hypothetical protein
MNGSAQRVLRLLVLVIVAGGAAVLIAMNQELLASFWTQEGWNHAAPEETVRSFVQAAWNPKEGKKAADLLDRQTFEPELQGSRLVAVYQGAAMGRFKTPVRKLAPTAKVKEIRSELLARDGGSFRILAKYEDGQWGEFRVKKVSGARRIVKIPDGLFPKAPERGSTVY